MKLYTPKNVLVTGGAGFIGCNFVRYLLHNNPTIFIVNLDKLTYAGSLDNLAELSDNKRHEFIQGDINDAHLVSQLLQKHTIDTIVHFAAESHVDRSIQTPNEFLQTNIMGTFTLLEEARKYWANKNWSGADCRFHHISTDEVYGSLGLSDPAFTENTPYAPNSPYSASKAASDHLVRSYFHTYALPVTMTHCSNNYGPYQHQEKFIPTIISACLKQQPIPVYGNGTNIRDWLHVNDHCEGIWQVLTKGTLGEKYNIGGNNEISNLEVVKIITHYFDQHYPQHAPHARLIHYVTDRLGHDWRYAINANKIKQATGWEPATRFASGIQETIEWFINKQIASIEIE